MTERLPDSAWTYFQHLLCVCVCWSVSQRCVSTSAGPADPPNTGKENTVQLGPNTRNMLTNLCYMPEVTAGQLDMVFQSSSWKVCLFFIRQQQFKEETPLQTQSQRGYPSLAFPFPLLQLMCFLSGSVLQHSSDNIRFKWAGQVSDVMLQYNLVL